MSKLRLYYPTHPWSVGQAFGNVMPIYTNLGLKGHNGLDCYAPDGVPVRAAHDGIVTFTGEDGSGGLGVVIRTDEQYDYGADKSYFKTISWHIKPNTFKVKPGDKVKAGDIIALADNTGLSTGSHLHFGLKPVFNGDGEWNWLNREQNNGYAGAIDPVPYFTGINAKDLAKYNAIATKLISVLETLIAYLKGRR